MIEPGQVWEFCGDLTVLTLWPRPDLDYKFVEEWEKAGVVTHTRSQVCWDVVFLRNHNVDEGCLDWVGIEECNPNWVRLA